MANMSDPLRGSVLKVLWAQKKLIELRKYVTAYVSAQPHRFPVELDGDSIRVSPPILWDMPHIDLPMLVGDCIGAMRASLDYIAWELAGKHAGRDLVPGVDRPYFPLYTDFDKYRKNVPLAGYQIPTEALNQIEAVQPYQAGYEPLALLHDLANQDKHRLPLLVVANLKAGDISGANYGGVALTVKSSSAQTVEFNAPSPQPTSIDVSKMEVEAKVSTFVALDNSPMPWEPVDVTLENIWGATHRVVKRMRNLFP